MGAANGGVREVPGTGAPPLEIREVLSRRDLDRFAKFAAEVYVHDPQWVAPLLLEVKEFLNRKKHPFYLHGDAAMFLALRSGRPVGRILVSDDPNYNAFHRENLGCFGKFESVDDPQVAHGLLDAAAAWLRKRGRTEIRGPIDYSMNYPCGLLVDGFDTPPQVMMNHNPPYYGGLLESWGLAKVKDLYAWWFNDPYDMLAEWRSRVEWLKQRSRVTVRPFRRSEFHAEVNRCNEIYSTAYKDNWGFVPLTDAEFAFLAKQLNQIAHEKQVLLAEADGKTVGFSITLPDMNAAIRPLAGRLTTFGIPIGLVRLLWRMRRVKSARMLVLVVRQEYRRRGVSELLILNTLEFGKKILGYTSAELGWTLEDNYLINRTVERVGAKRYKTYRIYEKKL
jgi:GNAT superfamily N-acetyltransferase